MTHGAKVWETRGPLRWLTHYYPQTFSRPFTGYQKEFWEEWAWEAMPGVGYRPRVECEPRGVGKSTSAETFVVQALARRRFNTVGYVSRTEEKASQHFSSIKRKIEAPALLADYPHLAPRVQVYRNMLSAWSQDRLVTDAGQMVIPITLLGSRRGFKSEDDVRFDLIVLDDIDELGESEALRQKNLDLLKSEILAAGTSATVVLFAQNLIHKDSICSQVLDHRADILSERDFRGPYPLMKWYDAEKIDLPDGAKRWVITGGEPHDPALDVGYCESLLNQFGKDTFDRECQQDTSKVAGEKSFREYDERYHVITWAEFARVFGGDAAGRGRIPTRWHKGRGLDWGTTREHPSAVIYAARPSKAEPLSDCVFVFGEIVRPLWPAEPHAEAELVSPGRIADAVKEFERRHDVRQEQLHQSLMSHEASAARNAFVVDMPEERQTFWRKWKAKRGSGVAQVQEKLEIDAKKSHPFRRDPKTGQALQGCPRLFFVVADGQGELYYDPNGQLRVVQPTDEKGLARLRAELPEYDERATGQNKIFDDAVDALRGMAAAFFVTAAEKTVTERAQDRMQPGVRLVDIPSLPTEEQRAQAITSNILWAGHFVKEEEEKKKASKGRVTFRR
jgi:hypothetical protein